MQFTDGDLDQLKLSIIPRSWIGRVDDMIPRLATDLQSAMAETIALRIKLKECEHEWKTERIDMTPEEEKSEEQATEEKTQKVEVIATYCKKCSKLTFLKEFVNGESTGPMVLSQ